MLAMLCDRRRVGIGGRRFALTAGLALCLACEIVAARAPAMAASYQPAIDFETVLDAYFDYNGLVSFTGCNVIFAPEQPVDATVDVYASDGRKVAGFKFYPDYKLKEKVFGSLMAQRPADVSLEEPGSYELRYSIGGEVATRFPFEMIAASTGDDPFDPDKTYRFTGPWQRFGYLRLVGAKGAETVELTYWPGAVDLAGESTREKIRVEVLRDGEVVGHGKATQSVLLHSQAKQSQRTKVGLHRPHEEGGEANAAFLPLSDLRDGSYRLKITRLSDGKAIRDFSFGVAGGKISPHPRSVLGYTPREDFISPRVRKKGSSGFTFEEVFWIESKP